MKWLTVPYMIGRHSSSSMMDLGNFMKDTHCETGEEKRGEGWECGRGGRETPVPTKLYQKTMTKKRRYIYMCVLVCMHPSLPVTPLYRSIFKKNHYIFKRHINHSQRFLGVGLLILFSSWDFSILSVLSYNEKSTYVIEKNNLRRDYASFKRYQITHVGFLINGGRPNQEVAPWMSTHKSWLSKWLIGVFRIRTSLLSSESMAHTPLWKSKCVFYLNNNFFQHLGPWESWFKFLSNLK